MERNKAVNHLTSTDIQMLVEKGYLNPWQHPKRKTEVRYYVDFKAEEHDEQMEILYRKNGGGTSSKIWCSTKKDGTLSDWIVGNNSAFHSAWARCALYEILENVERIAGYEGEDER